MLVVWSVVQLTIVLAAVCMGEQHGDDEFKNWPVKPGPWVQQTRFFSILLISPFKVGEKQVSCLKKIRLLNELKSETFRESSKRFKKVV